MKVRIFLIWILLYSSPSFGFDMNQLKVKARSLVVKYLDEETANKWFGPPPETILLPEIPRIEKNAKSTDIFIKKKRKDVKISKKDKQKYDYLFLKELLSNIRKDGVTEEEFSKWMNVLSQGSSREGIYRGLVLDNVYASYENFGGASSEATIDFAKYFLEKYTNRKIQKSSLQSANFYTIKRIVVERALDLFDAFPQNNDDLFDWYAVISSELAKSYSKTWENNLRKDKSRKRHKNWAKSVPIQFLKGELIIKLHKVFNSING